MSDVVDGEVVVEYDRDGVRFCTWGNYLINIWGDAQPNAQHLLTLGELTRKLHMRHREGINLLVVLEKAALPTAEQRKMLGTYYSSHSHCFRCVAQVLEGGGLWSQTVRGILTTVNLLQTTQYPAAVFRSIQAAGHWTKMHGLSGSPANEITAEHLKRHRFAA